MQENSAIELRGITKRFGKVIANDNISLEIRKGEILSLHPWVNAKNSLCLQRVFNYLEYRLNHVFTLYFFFSFLSFVFSPYNLRTHLNSYVYEILIFFS